MTGLLTVALFATALLFGGMAFFAAVIAPSVFRVLPADMAGRFLRGVFPPYYLWVLATSAAAAVALYPLSPLDAGIMVVIAGMAFWLRQVLMPRINALSDRAKAGDAEAKRGFDLSHRLSVAANLLQMVAAGAVLGRFFL
ncbi:DUF4149 domain-containing protein [Falsiroseomonas sp. E2-1-a20]|uniref:DUF4149 domain-containing protein n=1 Tax=Falsiroseomonas sp. E2-1-a20 TaxID=3239300 RepID=UPI003F316CCE